jgi:hypothetical protein
VEIVNYKMETAPRAEREVWSWLGKVLETLSHDGMSSEESTVEKNGVEVVLRVKKLPWRRDMETELTFIDSQRLAPAGPFGRQGTTPKRRERGEAPGEARVEIGESDRKPVEGLPAVFYNQTWLRTRCPRSVAMKVSKEPFIWMTLLVGGNESADEGDNEGEQEGAE